MKYKAQAWPRVQSSELGVAAEGRWLPPEQPSGSAERSAASQGRRALLCQERHLHIYVYIYTKIRVCIYAYIHTSIYTLATVSGWGSIQSSVCRPCNDTVKLCPAAPWNKHGTCPRCSTALAYIYIYTHTYTYIHTYIHTYIYIYTCTLYMYIRIDMCIDIFTSGERGFHNYQYHLRYI